MYVGIYMYIGICMYVRTYIHTYKYIICILICKMDALEYFLFVCKNCFHCIIKFISKFTESFESNDFLIFS